MPVKLSLKPDERDLLIAEMLEALIQMTTWCPSGFAPQSQSNAYRLAYAAIAKAKAIRADDE